jgi:hypothetical protein
MSVGGSSRPQPIEQDGDDDEAAHERHRRLEEHFSTNELRDRSNQDHADILAALRVHDPRAAGNLMRRHLTRVERELSRAWPTIAGPARPESPAPAPQPKRRVKVSPAHRSSAL